MLDELARRDKRVFVDLKFFDIPATAAAVIKRLSQWPVSYATIHGWHPAMMEACAANSGDMRLLAVTVLTSMGRPDLAQMGIDREPVDVVVERAGRPGRRHRWRDRFGPGGRPDPRCHRQRILDRLPGHPPRWPGRR